MATRGWEHATPADVRDRRAIPVKAKPSKYHAVKTTVDNITFDSKAEAKRYQELKVLEQAGEIHRLDLQPRFPLYVRNPTRLESEPIGAYRGDFSYSTRDGARIVEDVKGVMTPLAKWKIRHCEAQYGITVRIVR